ncbi:MAG: hypothetical protein GY926_22490 [bacterium]|nr:hypothetical protein [bacterium]
MSDWWTATTDSAFEQGDLFTNVQIYETSIAEAPTADKPAKVEVKASLIDAIIVTQTFDLANTKATEVLIARVLPWKDFAEAQYQAGNTSVISKGYIENVRRGYIPPLTILASRDARPPLPWSIVDFRELTTVPRSLLAHHIQQPGSKQRLRLMPPYKEHFAQAFARYFMRVGLPHDVQQFTTEAKEQTRHLNKK